MTIIIHLNGKKEEIESDMSISKLLEATKNRPEVVTVELNDKIIEKDKFQVTLLRSDDKLEFIHYMGSSEENQKPIPRRNKVFDARSKISAQGGSTLDGKNQKLANNVLELIGQTPMVRLNKIAEPNMADILAKLEYFNPGGSVKDRICLSMIEDAEKKELIAPGSTIIEPTSGNTGIGLALVCTVKGYRCILTMPETMSLERIHILKSYGAKVILTPGIDGISGSIKMAEKLLKKIPNSFMLQQFKNEANPQIHRETTAQEILRVVNGKIDAFVAGIGTGGTITGVGQVLRQKNPKIKIVAVEPETSAVLSGGKPGPHKIQGLGAGFIPQVLDRDIIDEIIPVGDKEAFKVSRRLAREEGLLVGISAGAAIWAALRIAKDLGKGKVMVVILADTGERYFSMEQYFEV